LYPRYKQFSLTDVKVAGSTQELEKTRQKGRPRKGWREEAERDLQVLRVRRWREMVLDREKWRGIVRHAKAHSGQ
jgi:hypothetical protein